MPYLKEEIKAGFIIVSAFLILSIVIIVIGGKHFLKSYDYYYIKVKNVTGIDVGSQVKLAGVTVGSIVDIMPPQSPGDFVTIKIGLKKGTKLFKGTQAMISQIGFIGDIFLLLAVDNTLNDPIVPGSIIPSSEHMQFTTLMSKLDELSHSVNNLVTDMDKVFSPKNLSHIDGILENTNTLMGGASSNINKISTSLHDVTDQLSTVLKEMQGLVKDSKGGINDILKKSSADLEKTGDMIKAIEQAANSVGKTSRSVDRAINAQNNNIDELLRSMTKTAENMQEVLQEFKHRPWSIIYKEGKGEEER
ncbi:MAG: MCE family protein [Nitrospirae bacterium]|nr:MCE family protein [Nitrospirota bacterium]MBF0541727.1 MCE family protein [Nitrospirota bacterium]